MGNIEKFDAIASQYDIPERAGILRALSFGNVTSEIFHRGERIFMNQDASIFILEAAKN